jgi:phosphoenolpyruvate-protein kinase (PTS system EI component)
LEAQLRAVLEVSQQFRIGVLIPMVTTESDVVQVVELFHRLAVEMGIRELPRIGAMIETPAAALSIPSLKKHVDFLSIGSKQPVQFIFSHGELKHHFKDAEHGHIWPLVIYDHRITRIHPSSISLFKIDYIKYQFVRLI